MRILDALYGTRQLSPEPVLARLVSERLDAGLGDGSGQAAAPRVLELLSEHAREVCHAAQPLCGACELRKFCRHFRDREQRRWHLDTGSLTVVDLFCGCGGASLGFAQAGFQIQLAVDSDPWAVATFRLNHPELPEERVICKDLSELEEPRARQEFRERLTSLLGGRRVNVVVGGPPCQGFSLVGTRGRGTARAHRPGRRFIDDEGNRLYRYFLMIVDWLQPDFCVMENVPAMIQIGQGVVMRQVLQDLRQIGYTGPRPRVHDCFRYGVPQTRRRALFLAGRAMFGDLHVQAIASPVLGDAIRDLPALEPGTGAEVVLRTTDPTSEYARRLAAGTLLIHNHVARPHQASDIKLYGLLRPGERIEDRPDLRDNRDLMKYQTKTFKDKYRRQDYGRPSSTIVAHLQKDGNMFIHPEQARTFTVREAARIQSFPDDYIFCGTRTHQFRQVGNAIPPLFMRRVARYLASLLNSPPPEPADLVQLVLNLEESEPGCEGSPA